MHRKIVFTTVARSDFSYINPIIEKIKDIERLNVNLLITGAHYCPNTGMTANYVKKNAKVEVVEIDPYKGKINMSEAEVCANILIGLNEIDFRPDILVLLGDRFEILPIALFCILNSIIIAHLFGGECDTSYCFDTIVRNAITKMAHVHFVAHEDIKKRLICMGEEDGRIVVVGNPSISLIELNIDYYNSFIFEFLNKHNIPINKPLVNVCYHPLTTDRIMSIKELNALLDALKQVEGYTYIWSGINSDPGSIELKRSILDFVAKNDDIYFFDNLGTNNYYSLLKNAKFMIGNSSSGMLEASSFNLPVINIGDRQGGRLHGENVFDVRTNVEDIVFAIRELTNIETNYKNPFYKHYCIDTIVDTLCNIRIDKHLRLKKLNCDKKMTLKRS